MARIGSTSTAAILIWTMCLLTSMWFAGSAAAQVTVTGGTTKVAASTSTAESLNIPAGIAPTTPATGAVFFDGTELYFNDGVANQPHPRIVRLAADSSSSSTTMANLMTFGMAANTSYTVECDLFYQGSATSAGLTLQFTSAASANNVIYGGYLYKNTATVSTGVATAYTTPLFGGTFTVAAASTNYIGHISGTIENATSSGTLQFQFANVVSTSSITVKRGSWCQIL